MYGNVLETSWLKRVTELCYHFILMLVKKQDWLNLTREDNRCDYLLPFKKMKWFKKKNPD